jgi:hypothetical protein
MAREPGPVDDQFRMFTHHLIAQVAGEADRRCGRQRFL